MSTKGGTNITKDVVYIDVDDEITGIIDKVRGSDKKIVALVLPKRATVLQSVVNMKLLKRAADDAKKHLVLITSESGLMPLAGSVGVHIAKSINSKPEIPDGPERADDKQEMVEEPDVADEPVAEEVSLDESKTVGELSGATSMSDNDLDDTIELDDEELPEETEAKEKESAKAGKGKHKKFKIPNFNKFRVGIVLIVLGIFLLGGLSYAAFVVAPKATVTIKTDRSAVNSSLPVTLKTAAGTTLDAAQGIVPAQSQEVKKTITQDAPATGQVNNGDKATGNVTLMLTDCSKDQVTVPAGTGLSASGKTFITQQTVTMYSVKIGGVCKNSTHLSDSSAAVGVKAQTGGTGYNIPASSFTVSGYSNVSGQSSAAMSGGTDAIVKVLTQADVDGAKQKITEQDTKPIELELKNALIGRGLLPIDVTFSVGTPDTKLSAEVGAPADTVTVTQTITYSMLGAKQDDLQQVVQKDVSKKIDTKKQKIIDYGLNKATFNLQSNSPDGVSVTMDTTAVAGAELNIPAIKQQIAGKKAGDAQDLIKASPGVTDVTVQYSPFWVSSIPKNTSKITVTVQQPQVVTRDANAKP